MDASSDILAAIRLDGAVCVKAEFKAPWCVQTQYGLPTAASRLPRSDHIVFFHLLTDGSCLARLADGSKEVEVTAGDLLLFPHDHRHILKGWLAGLQNPYVGRALALLHGDPKRAWTVDELAREVALSRSALAERFTDMIGAPAMQYLTQWRLTLGAQALRAGSDGIARIAERSGYDWEAAFTRAFKREFGVPPRVRRKNGGRGTADSAASRAASA